MSEAPPESARSTAARGERGRDAASVPPAPASSSDWEGATLDFYDVGERLGKGGMGAVYLGHDRSLDRKVAIKVLPLQLGAEPRLQQRFVREARAQAKLQSAQVVHIYHIGETPTAGDAPGALYFAMEYVPGGSLADTLERGEKMTPERARTLMREAALGLRAAHRAGIVHRDIKPGNLLLDSHGHLKIADFGVAKPLGADPSISQIGMVVGSPTYMAPEQAKSLEVDERADMYALGCTFYHLLAGRPPFEGKSHLAVLTQHMTKEAEPLAKRAPQVPRSLAAIIERLMHKDPSERYASYEELLAALDKAAPATTSYAGFSTRAAAAVIDALLGGVFIALLGWPGMLVYLAYLTLAHAKRGRTLGKYLLNLQVQRVDGTPLGLGRSLARTLASLWMPIIVGFIILLSEGSRELVAVIERLQPSELDAARSVLLGLVVGQTLLSLLYLAGHVLAAFHPQKRAAHDLVAGSRVVFKLKR